MVKLTVKTIKGDKFRIEVEQTQTVREAKGVIEATNAEFPAAQLKLIHSGKILKDESTLEEYQIKEDDFLVCMVTKPKPSAAPAPSAAATSAPAAAAAAPAPTSSSSTHAASPSPAAGTAGVAAGRSATDRTGLNAEHVSQLTDMGFPEDQAVAALRAAMGNPDVAVEFLMTGIPDHTQAAPAPADAAAAPQTRPMETLDDFRGHPHFNDLKRLVQRDPAMLSHVLQVIGQQSPTLLSRIHENQGEFIALMNEPVDESIPPTPAATPGGSAGGVGSMGAGGQPTNPAHLAQMLQNLNPAQRAHMAAMTGVSPQQLAQVSQLISQMPPEQLQQMMGMFSAGTPGAGFGGMRGMPPGAAGTGGNVIRLTPEEGAAVARLSELGFDRTDAAQAYLACDKNEALAANLLMDGMGAMGMGTGVPPAFQAQAPAPAVPATDGASVASNPTAPAPAPTPTASTTADADATNPPSAESGSVTGEAVEGSAPTAQGAPPANVGDDADGRAEGGDKDEDMYG